MNKDSCGIDSIFLKWILAVGMFPPPPISVYHQLQTGPSIIFQALKPSTAFSWNTNMSKSFRPWLSAHSNVGNLHCRNTGIQQSYILDSHKHTSGILLGAFLLPHWQRKCTALYPWWQTRASSIVSYWPSFCPDNRSWMSHLCLQRPAKWLHMCEWRNVNKKVNK